VSTVKNPHLILLRWGFEFRSRYYQYNFDKKVKRRQYATHYSISDFMGLQPLLW